MTALPFVVGTAGHIDHGKTALVHALTGIDTDRLAVEKARGITTELGFAHLDLPSGARVAVVDVPGHERFIRAMVAGATGLDLVVLVIAADEGVMPQTREHLDVCQLLGVRRGLVAITKRDLVDDDWLAMLDDELAAAFAGTFLADAPRLPVSARTGAGLPALIAAIEHALASLPPRPTTGLLRVPIDRVFTLRGFGTVVTGTIASGQVALGDEVAVYPRGLATRVRGLHVHGVAVERATAGQRCALNLHGVATDDLARGDVVGHVGALAPSHLLDVTVRHVAAATAPLPVRSKVLVHHGAAQVQATLVLAGAPLPPGGEGVAQLRIDRTTPLVALPGDHFLVRGFTPLANHGTTLAGGTIVRVHAPKLRSTAARAAEHAAVVARFADARAADRVALELRALAAAVPDRATLGQRLGLAGPELATTLAELVARGDVLGAGDDLLHVETVAALERAISARLAAAPDGAVPREELRQRLPAALSVRGFELVIAELVRRGVIEVDAELVRRASAPRPRLTPADDALHARFRGWGLEAPRPKDIAETLRQTEAQLKPALDRLVGARLIVKVKPDYYADAEAIATLRARLLAYLAANREIAPQAWKEVCGTSRKYSIPLAEHFDAEKVTLRIGDLRRKR
ncbi:MAG: selenocysteine-specific translation elongation factor [Myxococcales bacterium]|nr:selenocysteine-specific translation elongation factor [Myxococcales bacterium]